MADNLDWTQLADDYEFPSQRAAERSLGLTYGIIATWRNTGVLPKHAALPLQDGFGKLSSRPVTVGEIRPGLVQYHPIRKAPATSFSEEELDIICVSLQLYVIDATRSERKIADKILTRLMRRDEDEEVAS